MMSEGLTNKSIKITDHRKDTPVIAHDAGSMVAAIARAASDPSVDVAKMQALFAMHKEIIAHQAEVAFNSAMSRAQEKMGPVKTDAENKQTKSKYATYEALDRAVRPYYTAEGFSLSFDTADCPKPDYIRVVCFVAHSGGHTRIYHHDVCADGKGAKGGDVMTKTHAGGAAMSYGSRYILRGIFNIAVGEDDRDGNEAVPTINEKQVADLDALLDELQINRGNFLRWAKVERLEDIAASAYPYVVGEVERKRKESK